MVLTTLIRVINKKKIMKSIKINIQRVSYLLFCGVFIISCTKSFDEKTAQQTDFSNSSLIQVYMATVSATRNYVYVDGKSVTGAALSLGSVYPSIGYASSIPGGFRSFLIKDTLSTSTQLQLSFAENMKVGKNYTIFMYDTINSPRQKTIETDIVIPSDSTARLRFANFVFSKTAVPAVDIFSKRQNTNVFTNIQISEATDYIKYPSALTDTFYVRETGTTNLLATLNGLTPIRKRSYTLVFRGRYQTTTGTIARTLSSFSNN